MLCCIVQPFNNDTRLLAMDKTAFVGPRRCPIIQAKKGNQNASALQSVPMLRDVSFSNIALFSSFSSIRYSKQPFSFLINNTHQPQQSSPPLQYRATGHTEHRLDCRSTFSPLIRSSDSNVLIAAQKDRTAGGCRLRMACICTEIAA